MIVAPTGQASADTPDMGKVAEAAGKVWDVETNEFVAAWTCPSGYVCFYSGAAGTGRACQWWGADDNWLAGSVTCSWARTDSVESVYNNGTSTAFNGVRYYTQTDYRTSVGCIPRGAHGTLNTSRLLRSHKWESGSCG
jgi:peptidase inhibitor family I36